MFALVVCRYTDNRCARAQAQNRINIIFILESFDCIIVPPYPAVQDVSIYYYISAGLRRVHGGVGRGTEKSELSNIRLRSLDVRDVKTAYMT